MNNETNIENMASVIVEGLNAFKKEIHTCFPCIVDSFDSDAQTITAKPVIKRIFKDVNTGVKTVMDLPVLINVPIMFPKGGGFSLTFPIAVGDECMVFFCERSIDDWFDSGESKEQNQKRFHDLSDGVAFVGLCSKPKTLSNYNSDEVQLRSNDESTSISIDNSGKIKLLGEVEITGNVKITGNVETDGDTETTGNVTVNGDTSNTGNVDTIGNITSTGTVRNNNIAIDATHQHPNGNNGNPTGTPTP